MWTGVMRGFCESGVVERALDTASTFVASFGASLGWFAGGSLPGCLDEDDGVLRCGGMCLGKRPRGPGGEGVPRVANVRLSCRGSRNDQRAAAGSIFEDPLSKSQYVNAVKISVSSRNRLRGNV